MIWALERILAMLEDDTSLSADEMRDYVKQAQHKVDTCYMLLPFDREGTPVRVGDEMQLPSCDVVTVGGVGDGVFYFKQDPTSAMSMYDWGKTEVCHHYQSTVEDVLHEFAEAYVEGSGYEDKLIAEFAKRLKLVDG